MKKKTHKKQTTRTPPALTEQFPAIALIARVSGDSREEDANELSQAELCLEFSVSDQTIRNWTKRGLPWRRGPDGKPRYPAFEARQWCLCWLILEGARDYDKKTSEWLTPGYAINWHMQNSMDSMYPPGRRGVAYVVVPLHWDHPAREQLLRLAARGAMPPCESPEGSLEGEDFADALQEVAGVWSSPLPRVRPSPPLPVPPELLEPVD